MMGVMGGGTEALARLHVKEGGKNGWPLFVLAGSVCLTGMHIRVCHYVSRRLPRLEYAIPKSIKRAPARAANEHHPYGGLI